MRKDFAEALGDLLALYSDLPIDEVISTMELHLDGLRDQERFEQTSQQPLTS